MGLISSLAEASLLPFEAMVPSFSKLFRSSQLKLQNVFLLGFKANWSQFVMVYFFLVKNFTHMVCCDDFHHL
jgi:hypothetical protein